MHPRFTTSPCMKSRGVNPIPHGGIPNSSAAPWIPQFIIRESTRVIHACAPTLAPLPEISVRPSQLVCGVPQIVARVKPELCPVRLQSTTRSQCMHSRSLI
jgi:hypothetical protein